MKPFECLDNAVILNRRSSQSLYEALSHLLTRKPVRFTCNTSVVDDNGQIGHYNRVLAVLQERHAIEIVGVDFVTYRIPYGARVEISEAELRVEMRSIVCQRQNHTPLRWQFVVQDSGTAVGIPAHDDIPPSLPPHRMAWPMREDVCLRILQASQFEMEVTA